MKRSAGFAVLKQSTIEDHIIEIASESSSFPLFDYVPAAYAEKIRAVSNTLQTRKMKELKINFPMKSLIFIYD
ncbi:helix-turn-helix domain-containing protein [Sinobaca sp. H24]|uniref:helix-turn-helix domain-containing protein n=1 Tax=Sinobaca sp. H24 TaxID=2923376 RepID=UPI0035B19BB5